MARTTLILGQVCMLWMWIQCSPEPVAPAPSHAPSLQHASIQHVAHPKHTLWEIRNPMWVQPALHTPVEGGEGEMRGMVWQRDTEALGLSPLHLIPAAPRKNMVMVSFDTDSPLGQALYKSPFTQAWHPRFALVEIQNSDHLTDLATQAHQGRFCGNLEHISGLPLTNIPARHYAPIYPERLRLTAVAEAMRQVYAPSIEASIHTLVQMGSRGHDSPQGEQVPSVIQKLVEQANQGKLPLLLEISPLNSDYTNQDNVIVTLPGTHPERIILGAHMDTILGQDSRAQAPGADDDASGVATLIETIRILAQQNAHTKRTVEFHFYAAEEVGLMGSSALAEKYQSENIPVAAMFQLDMDAFSKDASSTTIYLVTNDTSPTLRRSLKDLMNTYLGGNYDELALQAGTSDHRSWTTRGYPSVFPFEHPLQHNPAIHTAQDTTARAKNFSLSARFTQLALAFIGHHGGLEAATEEAQTLLSQEDFSEDIPLAIQASPYKDNTWDLFAATSLSISKVTTCLLQSPTDNVCKGTITELTLLEQTDQRRFFGTPETSPLTLQDGEYRGMFAYNDADQWIAKRWAHVVQRP